MQPHPIQWTAPSPLWPELAPPTNGADRAEFRIPTILRFATDDFMQDFFNLLATDPRKLGEFRAVRETWRGKVGNPTIPTPKKLFALQMQRLGSRRGRTADIGAKVAVLPQGQELPRLKLYQPAHQRYYLISACLTCRIAGLPDRKVDTAKQERASFVLRRLFPPASTVPGKDPADAIFWDEYGWVKTPGGYAWQKVRNENQTADHVVLEGEERLPLFHAAFQDDDQRSRRLFAGLIPVGKREAYLGAQKVSTSSNGRPLGSTSVTARKILLRKQVIEPWKALVRQMATAGQANRTKVTDNGNRVPIAGDPRRIKSLREQSQVISWLILLDFAEFLHLYAPELWQAILSNTPPGNSQSQLAKAYVALGNAALPAPLAGAIQRESGVPIYSTPPNTLRLALAKFGDAASGGINAALKRKLESATEPYDRALATSRTAWPDFVFPLADPEPSLGSLLPPVLDLHTLAEDEQADLLLEPDPPADDFLAQILAQMLARIDRLAVLLVRAVAESSLGASAPEPDMPAAAVVPEDASNAVFRIRCVYERHACGPLHDDVVSDPTELFDLAGFFDPDAPARPIRIGLPIDTTPAGLRKFDKNTAFIMSDILCGQVQKMKSLGFIDLVLSVLPWPFHKDLPIADMKPCGSPSANFGMICSLSIPIITICALILLMIIVTLLDIIFRWMPYFMICFPLPGFKGKK
jgi:hypothetical protein